ncbi:helix-turn-helix domain-containing protein [Paenibacillus sp. CGMCC 1.16610]|uniref:Excisionase family DNA-binding protein n=1 Tax=Paenibacillus anseongense TaxID=2682845 RepID=A0ABW9TZU7_9BACL|nr:MULTISPECIES: helix-turn-helix domain-containing protein [Paenibacillus]MBA2937046.1 helix-turn-helix domain-containing protein [Paenibacillus sp. CGMCC 1.16610]MVQ33369.1 excisionase family DNA-binding protein [Paenibacillus anseongense]
MVKKKVTLTVKEVAEILGVSSDKIYEMARKKQIPHIKVGSRVIFHEDVLNEWMGAANVTPRGPLYTSLSLKENESDDVSVGTRYEMHLTAETIRLIQMALEIQETDIKKHLDEVFEESATKSIYYKDRPEDLEKRRMYAQRRYHALILALDEIDREFNKAQKRELR